MKPALLLIDLQNDYLKAPNLEPAAGHLVSKAAILLAECRRHAIPVVHIWTTVQRAPDNRMPHWKTAGTWQCVAGTTGHLPPDALSPASHEAVIHKQFFSGFGSPELALFLNERGCDSVIIAGVHLHACIRATALDAYARGLSVWIADDAVASDDPLHAAITRRYLSARAIRFAPVRQLLAALDISSGDNLPALPRFTHYSPTDSSQKLWELDLPDAAAIRATTAAARNAAPAWSERPFSQRADILRQWAAQLLDHRTALADQIVADIGKPITMARGEITRSADLLHATANMEAPPEIASSPSARFRYRPLGVVALISPYNNPIAIPAGKIAPALLYGNTVVWKPSPPASMIAQRLLELARKAGLPEDVLQLCLGDHHAASILAEDPHVDALTVSGSSHAGYSLQELCAKNHKPYQGELGGNNAAIVWDDAVLPAAAALIAEGAFGFAGQRCTANRRVIVAQSRLESFLHELTQAAVRLPWGDPHDPATIVGPLISKAKREDLHALVQGAAFKGMTPRMPHADQLNENALMERGAFFPPTIVLANDPEAEIVQEESFGPILVVQPAQDFNHALALANGVRQGLVLALFSTSPSLQKQFLAEARAGVLKLNRATADADAVSPLGGWKSSGVGPAEHGPADREFYARVQTIYQ